MRLKTIGVIVTTLLAAVTMLYWFTDGARREAIAAEIAETRQLCARRGWPVIDVTRRSIEETAAAILRLYHDRGAPVLDP